MKHIFDDNLESIDRSLRMLADHVLQLMEILP